MLDKHFGQQNAPLSRWLREHLLICTNNHYSMDDGKVKEYILNTKGAAYVKSLLQGQLQAEDKNPEMMSSPTPFNTLVSKKSMPDYDLFDREVILNWVKREYEKDLRTGDFQYNDKSSRLWHNLQSVRSDFRTESLKDAGYHWHYDIQCAAPTLIHQWSQRQPESTGEIRFALEHYLQNRHEVRAQVCEELNVDVKQAKTLINALFCGARLGANRDYALFWVLDADYDKVRAAQKSEYLSSLRSDIKACWDEIEPSLMKRTKVNKHGKTRKLPLNSKTKWMCYFDLERKVMNVIRTYLKGQDGRFFLIHDGFATSFEVNTKTLEELIYEQTGFKVILDVKILKE